MRHIEENPYIFVGRITSKVAKAANIECAKVYISDNNLRHIRKDHKAELDSLGIPAITFVRFIVANFNQIRRGSGNSLLLVVYNADLPNVAAITLNYSLKEKFWEVRTALPWNVASINKKFILYRKG